MHIHVGGISLSVRVDGSKSAEVDDCSPKGFHMFMFILNHGLIITSQHHLMVRSKPVIIVPGK